MNFEDWQVGDIIEKTIDSGLNSLGYQGTITKIKVVAGERHVWSTDEDGGISWMGKEYATKNYMWVRRPESENEWVSA